MGLQIVEVETPREGFERAHDRGSPRNTDRPGGLARKAERSPYPACRTTPAEQVAVQPGSVVSEAVHRDDALDVTVFGFAVGSSVMGELVDTAKDLTPEEALWLDLGRRTHMERDCLAG